MQAPAIRVCMCPSSPEPFKAGYPDHQSRTLRQPRHAPHLQSIQRRGAAANSSAGTRLSLAAQSKNHACSRECHVVRSLVKRPRNTSDAHPCTPKTPQQPRGKSSTVAYVRSSDKKRLFSHTFVIRGAPLSCPRPLSPMARSHRQLQITSKSYLHSFRPACNDLPH